LLSQRDHPFIDELVIGRAGGDKPLEKSTLISRLEQLLRLLLPVVGGTHRGAILLKHARLAVDEVATNGPRLRGIGAHDLVDGDKTRYGFIEHSALDGPKGVEQRQRHPDEQHDQCEQKPEPSDELVSQ
jgi:hypothetical protein